MSKWRLVHIILGQCRWEDIARHEILIWTKNQTPKNTSFKVNCTFVTTSLIFPQAYESLHTHAHTLALPCVFEQNEWGVSLLYRLLWYRQVSRCVCVCIFLSMHGVRTVKNSTANAMWRLKKGNKMFWLLYSVLAGETFVFNDTRACAGWVRSESYRVICH